MQKHKNDSPPVMPVPPATKYIRDHADKPGQWKSGVLLVAFVVLVAAVGISLYL